jgi:heptosyltransferase-2
MQRVVIVAPNWLGDAVMALPAIADVRRAFGDAALHVAARAPVAPLYTMVGGVDEVIALPGRGGVSAMLSWKADAAVIAAGRFDAAILLPNSFASALVVRRAGVPERWGFATDLRGSLLTRGVARPPAGGHQGAYYQALIGALGMKVGPAYARVDVTDAIRRRARVLLESALAMGRPIVALAPGAAYGRAKQWIPERFAELARLLLAEGAVPVLVGSRADRAVCAAIGRLAGRDAALPLPPGTRPAAIDLAGQTDLPTLAGVLTLATACVSNDSGAMHLAAAVGTKVVAVFGPTNERRTSPLRAGPGAPEPRVLHADVWCRPCMLRECPIDHRCMTGVSAESVMHDLRSQISDRRLIED